MSSSDRRTFLGLIAALPLAGCGFAPVYAPGGPGSALNGTILADAPEDRLDYEFVAHLETRIGRGSAARWALGYRIVTRQNSIGVSPENVITRYNLSGRLDWSVRPVGGGDPVLDGIIENVTSYSATGTTIATRSARRDAEERLMVILADQLVARLYAGAEVLGQ
jgi:LPS-assembly lipoprotein